MLPMLPADKANHFIYGTVLQAAGQSCGFEPAMVLGVVALIAVAKEVWDGFKNGEPSVGDAVCTVFGAVAVVVGAL
jgi:uncharacterized protein YfiM (DUF2279 family)